LTEEELKIFIDSGFDKKWTSINAKIEEMEAAAVSAEKAAYVERLEKAKEIKKNSTKVYGPLTEDIKIYVDKQIKQMRMKELCV
jgi:hypothetical protein